MAATTRSPFLSWTVIVPLVAILALALTFGRDIGPVLVAVVAVLLGAAVLAAVHHAEVVAHRVGEPFGSLVLAVAVTVIEVALIVTLMVSGGPETASLARDTVFAAVDDHDATASSALSLLVGARRASGWRLQRRGHRRGAGHGGHARHAVPGAADVHHQPSRGREFSPGQLAFAAVASLVLYGMFVLTQTVRHRDFFLPVDRSDGDVVEAATTSTHARHPDRTAAVEPRAAARRARRRRRAGEGRVARDRGRRSAARGPPARRSSVS